MVSAALTGRMGDTDIGDGTDAANSTALLRRLRPLIGSEAAPDSWRDDLRLFVLAWAAGFVFFLVVLA